MEEKQREKPHPYPPRKKQKKISHMETSMQRKQPPHTHTQKKNTERKACLNNNMDN